MRLAAIRIDRLSDPSLPSTWERYRRLWIAAGAIVAGIVLYFVGGAFIAYTADAYVRSDLVPIAPEVAGIVTAVRVAYNQKVGAGKLLATIDPESYRLAVDLKQQQIASLEAAVAAKEEAQVADAASVDAVARSPDGSRHCNYRHARGSAEAVRDLSEAPQDGEKYQTEAVPSLSQPSPG